MFQTWANQKEMRIFALSRSGQQAIIDWILTHASGKALFLNNVPHTELDNPHEIKYMGFTQEEINLNQRGRIVPKDLLLLNIENLPIEDGMGIIGSRQGFWHQGPSGQLVIAVVIRDPLNLFASRMKQYDINPDIHIDSFGSQSVATYLNHGYYCVQALKGKLPILVINYNLWLLNKNYRQQLGQYIGLQGNYEKPPERSGDFEAGSFGSYNTDKTSQTPVFDRWRAFKKDSRFQKLFQDQRIVNLARTLFTPVHPEYTQWLTECRENP